MATSTQYKEHSKCLIEVYDYSIRKSTWVEGRILNIVTALDRPFRVNVRTNEGKVFNECAPECIKPIG